MRKHRVVLTGGGTGGHIYPALSVHEQLIKDESVESLLYIGASGHMEEKLCQERNIQFCGLDVSGMPRKPGLRMFTWPFQTMQAIVRARQIMARFDPTVVLGTGGYASAAPLAAALQLGVPIAVHEPDAHPGLVNKLFSKGAKLVSLGMDGAFSQLKTKIGRTIVNGNPIRESFIQESDKAEALKKLGLEPGLKTIAITGGSQGALALNEAASKIIPELLSEHQNLQIIHQAGQQNIGKLETEFSKEILGHRRYLLSPYFEDMAIVYAASELVVCRAGAMTIAELTATASPAIFIPYPYAAQDHQMHNAKSLEAKGAAVVIPQTKLSSQNLKKRIVDILFEESKLKSMQSAMGLLGKPHASKNLAKQVTDLSDQYLKS